MICKAEIYNKKSLLDREKSEYLDINGPGQEYLDTLGLGCQFLGPGRSLRVLVRPSMRHLLKFWELFMESIFSEGKFWPKTRVFNSRLKNRNFIRVN